MAFNILCLARNPLIEAKFEAQLDGSGFELVAVDPRDFYSQPASYIDQYRPHCILQLLPDGHLIDDQYLDETTKLNAYSREHNIHFIQLSSFFVFGEHPFIDMLTETDKAADTELAQRFAKLESIFEGDKKAIILRTSWLLNDSEGGVFARILPVMLGQDKSLAVSDHNFGNPIHIRFLIDSIIAIIRQQLCGAKNTGVYHLCSADSASEAELADHLMRLLNNNYNQQLTLPPIAGAGDARTVMPVNAQLNATRVTHGFGIQLPTWRKGFKAVFEAWFDEHHQNNAMFESVKKATSEEGQDNNTVNKKGQ